MTLEELDATQFNKGNYKNLRTYGTEAPTQSIVTRHQQLLGTLKSFKPFAPKAKKREMLDFSALKEGVSVETLMDALAMVNKHLELWCE